MVQSEAAMEAYNSYWGGYAPAADITWMILIIAICIITLWQARVFVHDF